MASGGEGQGGGKIDSTYPGMSPRADSASTRLAAAWSGFRWTCGGCVIAMGWLYGVGESVVGLGEEEGVGGRLLLFLLLWLLLLLPPVAEAEELGCGELQELPIEKKRRAAC